MPLVEGCVSMHNLTYDGLSADEPVWQSPTDICASSYKRLFNKILFADISIDSEHFAAIGISGAVIGIGWSALGYYLGCLSNRRSNIPEGENSVGARAACATFLAFMSFVAADLKSRFPRLTTGCLLSVFTSIWLLAITVQEHEVRLALRSSHLAGSDVMA